MTEHKKVVLISFYERTSENTRMLSRVLKGAGHVPYLLMFKDDRATVINTLNKSNRYYQLISNLKYVGTGEDVNPPTEKEIDLLIEQIVSIQPDVIGFSSRSAAKELTKTLSLRLREVLPSTRYIGGGFGVSLEPEFSRMATSKSPTCGHPKIPHPGIRF